MKRLFIVLSVCFALGAIFYQPVFATNWITANSVTLSWTPVTKLVDGAVIPVGDVISYELFIVPETGDKLNDRIFKIEVQAAEATITFDQEGFFYLGVRAVRSKDLKRLSVSEIAWTDNPEIMVGNLAQGVIFYRQTIIPSGVEIK